VPARIEPDETDIAVEFESTDISARRYEPQHGRDLAAEPVDVEQDGEFRTIGPDRIFELHVEVELVPVEVHLVGEARPALEMRDCLLIGGEGLVRRE
jgi:hypothetical protein